MTSADGQDVDDDNNIDRQDNLEKLEQIAKDVVNDVIDHFKFLELVGTFSVNLSGVSRYSRQKSLLLKHVLEQILKYESPKKAYYEGQD